MNKQIVLSNIISLHGSEALVRRLTATGRLSDTDIRVLKRSQPRHIKKDKDILAEGETLGDILLLREGWAFRYRLLGDGRRHVLHFLIPGDVIGPLTPTAKHFVGSITDTSIIRVARHEMAIDTEVRTGLAGAIENMMVDEYETIAEHTVSLGRRNAKERMAHLLLELLERLRGIGFVEDDTYQLPLTQEIIGDALGLSVVHVNRTLKALREEGVATARSGYATIHDLRALSIAANTEACAQSL